MKFQGTQGSGGRAGGEEDPKITAFWARYAEVLQGARLPEKRHVWFRRASERFIAWLQPTRLAQTQREHVLDFSGFRPKMFSCWNCRTP